MNPLHRTPNGHFVGTALWCAEGRFPIHCGHRQARSAGAATRLLRNGHAAFERSTLATYTGAATLRRSVGTDDFLIATRPAFLFRTADVALGTRPTVLVVEDEAFVRLIAAEVLEDAGWTSIQAADAAEALSVLSTNANVDVLFTDINMRGMDGLELARCVHRTHPHIGLVITSGKRTLSDIELPDRGTFLPKPYGSQQLVNVIASKIHR